MRDISIGGKRVRVRASPLALLYYHQAFGTDLTGDMLRMRDLKKKPESFDACLVLQMAWAMARADQGLGKSFPPFDQWLVELGSVDFSDASLAAAVMGEAQEGFFRGARPGPGGVRDQRPGAGQAGPGVAGARQTGRPQLPRDERV